MSFSLKPLFFQDIFKVLYGILYLTIWNLDIIFFLTGFSLDLVPGHGEIFILEAYHLYHIYYSLESKMKGIYLFASVNVRGEKKKKTEVMIISGEFVSRF